MAKLRVYELAKETGLTSKEAMIILSRLGFEVKSHMSTLTDEQMRQYKAHLRRLEQPDDVIEKENRQIEKERQQRSKPKKEKLKHTDTEIKSQRHKRKGRKSASQKQDKKGHVSRAKKANAKNKEEERSASVKEILIGQHITVKDFSQKIGKSPTDVIKKLMSLGVMATINEELDAETASILGAEFGIDVKVEIEESRTDIQEIIDPPESLRERPPVVTVMGHVDHGKTSLLDAIRETNVTATEAGGITQHIGAYQVDIEGKKITFLDTPGHEAFTAMRARGAKATDVAILVVAADDGVMPQTVEAINHAKAAKVPIVVAINKIDKPNANPEKVKQELTEHGLVPEEWGGDTICVPVSAIRQEGITHLLEMVLLVAELAELKANPNRPAAGIVIESRLDKGRGPVATILVQKGTLKVGDSLIAGACYGKVRAMLDDKGKRVKTAGPSCPVEVLGLSEVPMAGDIFQVVPDDKLAREISSERQAEKREQELRQSAKVKLEELFQQMDDGGVKELRIIIKGDVQGSVEALQQSLERLSTDEVKVELIHGGVGAISETDVMLASASNAIIIGFNVRPDSNARKLAEKEGVDIRLYRVIYEAIEEVKSAMAGLLDPDLKEMILGRAEVRATFKVPKAGVIAGCYVLEGKITNNAQVRLIRDGVVIHEGKIESLKRFKDDAKEVAQGFECGIGIERYNDIKEGDIIEAYGFKEVQRQL